MFINVYINGLQQQVTEGSSLQDLLSELSKEHDTEMTATAVNEIFIPKTQRAQHTLKPEDRIAIFSPITGG
ncbi:sulfur carrier protein ThiS [Brackiella oedipodis]|uniref:sulfur carrier protein ThiS n=1 Tax=Brackiella oedipodis TaxID=124225 RepID=UPI000491BC86|nr:sulfur carrier protein ThiS [Brackiella oedipodis]